MNKTSKDISDKALRKAVKKSLSYRSVCRNLDVNFVGRTYRNIRNRIIRLELDTTHFRPFSRPNHKAWNKLSLDEILVKDSTYLTSRLRKRLIAEGILQEKCSECGIGPEWNGKELSLQLDHINGIDNDHRIENLRILCPNCHSQTPTYCGRNINSGQ